MLLEEMHAATLQRTTRRNNDIQVLKGVCRVTVCTTGLGLQRHPIGFQNHFHLFGFDVQVLLLNFYFMLLEEMYAATLHGTTSLSILLSWVFCLFVCLFVLFVCFVCLFVCFVYLFVTRHAFRGRGLKWAVRGVHGKPSTGRGAQRQFRGGPGPGRGDTEFGSIYGPGNGRKMEKLAKIREILEKSHNPNPREIM